MPVAGGCFRVLTGFSESLPLAGWHHLHLQPAVLHPGVPLGWAQGCRVWSPAGCPLNARCLGVPLQHLPDPPPMMNGNRTLWRWIGVKISVREKLDLWFGMESQHCFWLDPLIGNSYQCLPMISPIRAVLFSQRILTKIQLSHIDQIFFWQYKSFLWELKLELDPFRQETVASAQVVLVWKYYSAFFVWFQWKNKIYHLIMKFSQEHSCCPSVSSNISFATCFEMSEGTESCTS